MNTDPASAPSRHLDLADLIAEVTGQATGGRDTDHLAACDQCRAEANRWNLVADGVRGLAAGAPDMTPPARPRLTRPRVLADPRRRTTLATSSAAALILLGGAGYGAAAALTRHTPGTASTGTRTTALTAVSGCAALRQADGTLEQVNGTTLVIKTASGQPVTVTTTATTEFHVSRAPLSYITDGARVIVTGHSSSAAIAADHVSVGPMPSPYGKGAAGGIIVTPPGIVAARGTVADASATGFTVVKSDGTRVPVVISAGTDLDIPTATLSQLQAGAPAIAVGYPQPDGTLSAIVAGSGRLGTIDLDGCAPAQVNAAMSTALGA